MKLLIITQKVDENDVALSFFIGWLKIFSQNLDKLYIICMWEGKHENIGDNVTVFSLGKEKGFSKPRQLFNFYRHSLAVIKDVDAVFVHMNPIWVIFGWLIFKLSRKPIALWYAQKSITLKLRLAVFLTDRVFSASSKSFRIKNKKVIFSGHGVDTGLFKPPEFKRGEDMINVLSVGRITPSKNQEMLIRAADYIVNKKGIKNINFRIVGGPAVDSDYKYYEKIKKLVKEFNLDSHINFKGQLNHNNLPAIYRESKIYINNSLTGSIDKDVLEAAASGCLILTSNEAFKDEIDSKYLFKSGDYVGLGNKIISFLNQQPDPRLREWVIKNHNLDNLISFLKKELNKITFNG